MCATTQMATTKMVTTIFKIGDQFCIYLQMGALAGSHGGNSVQVEGSFDNWTKRLTLERSNKDFTIIKLLSPGVYQFKFIVDGEWRYDPNQPAMYDEIGNVNNVIEVQEYLPENLDGLTGFEPPPSPDASYDNAAPHADDFNRDPPVMPAHLNLTLLNVPPAMDAQAVLPRPQHVILNHSYVQRASEVPPPPRTAGDMPVSYSVTCLMSRCYLGCTTMPVFVPRHSARLHSEA